MRRLDRDHSGHGAASHCVKLGVGNADREVGILIEQRDDVTVESRERRHLANVPQHWVSLFAGERRSFVR
jgi:hypothetical protein